jgi:transposase
VPPALAAEIARELVRLRLLVAQIAALEAEIAAQRHAAAAGSMLDAASIEVERRRRRVKTDGIDLDTLMRVLLALQPGEPRVCRQVQAPSASDEDAKRRHRERGRLLRERVAHVNRIRGAIARARSRVGSARSPSGASSLVLRDAMLRIAPQDGPLWFVDQLTGRHSKVERGT